MDELEHSRREKMALHEMLAHALQKLGEPLRISKEDLVGGKFEGKYIDMQEDIPRDEFVISLREINE